MFELIHKEKSARAGLLKTSHGTIKTPFFMPVATKGTVKHVSAQELVDFGTDAIISNAMLLFLNPGVDLIHKAGGIHKFIGFDKVIFTDSGGFQMLEDEFFLSINDEQVKFKNPMNGTKYSLTPEQVIGIQNTLGSDVAMCLDHVPTRAHSKKEIAKAVKRTTEWAIRCKEAHKNKKQLLFAINQGGIHKDLRQKSTKDLAKIGFDGYALGGLSIGEDKPTMDKMVQLSANHFPKDAPRYFMGLGSPVEILQSVKKGIDIFDSCMATRNARHGWLFTSYGTLRLWHKRFETDLKPLDKNCDCFVCKKYSRAFLRFNRKRER